MKGMGKASRDRRGPGDRATAKIWCVNGDAACVVDGRAFDERVIYMAGSAPDVARLL